MLTKNELKYIQSLGHKKHRDIEGVFIAEGPKMAEELLSSGFDIVQVYATRDWIEENANINIPVKEISDEQLQKVTNLFSANKVLVVAKQKIQEHAIVLEDQLTLVLDGIQDPGNMGTIIRIADWFGIKQIVCSTDSVDIYNPKVVQSTMGSIIRVDVWYADLADWIKAVTVPVYGALLDGEDVNKAGKVDEGVLIIGNESKGIRSPLHEYITHPVSIPRYGHAESLNAAVATAIIAASFRRG